jgi:hypothetical protein
MVLTFFVEGGCLMVKRSEEGRAMKTNVVRIGLLLCAFLLVGSQVRGQGSFGIGLIIGEPTGFSWKYKASSQNALDGAIGFSPADRFRAHIDYLWVARPFSDGNLTLTYGVGGVVGFGDRDVVERRGGFAYFNREVGFAARVPVGLNYMIPRSPVELGLEVAPLLILAPDGGLGIDGGFLVRFYP